MSTEMIIRVAEPCDRERLLAIWEASVRATHGVLSDEDIKSLRDRQSSRRISCRRAQA